eukprot:366514-Chlamydomonas_euryale.AAC.5
MRVPCGLHAGSMRVPCGLLLGAALARRLHEERDASAARGGGGMVQGECCAEVWTVWGRTKQCVSEAVRSKRSIALNRGGGGEGRIAMICAWP